MQETSKSNRPLCGDLAVLLGFLVHLVPDGKLLLIDGNQILASLGSIITTESSDGSVVNFGQGVAQRSEGLRLALVFKTTSQPWSADSFLYRGDMNLPASIVLDKGEKEVGNKTYSLRKLLSILALAALVNRLWRR